MAERFGSASFAGTIGVIGAGRLGGALARALVACGYRVDKVVGRSGDLAQLLARASGAAPASASEVVAACDLVVLAVPDGVIEVVAGAEHWRPGQAVVHCSGAVGLEALRVPRARGALVGCFHPLQSFSGDDGPERFRGVTVGVEGSAPLAAWLETMARDLGATPLPLEGVDRARYHAAAVLVSNDVVALMAAAARTWEAAGLPREEARAALAPLLLGAARNIEARPLEQALTGPVARGDVETVRRHLEALRAWPDLLALYRALGRELLGLALAIDPAARAALEALFADEVVP
ncbi:MAG: DUF2520 domain-containing protein [Dehalococcoidia bacterium]|nr:DUF2520 domain-containing protein [Dehalococcoidia bacterium]